MMNISRIKETCLYISNLEKAKEFYTGKLGLPVISFVEGRHIFFRAGQSVLLCFIAEITEKNLYFHLMEQEAAFILHLKLPLMNMKLRYKKYKPLPSLFCTSIAGRTACALFIFTILMHIL
jgi:hypothetical protein